jgi:fructokinase
LTYAGVELGGTKCVAILAEGPSKVIARKTVSTSSPGHTLAKIADTISGWQSKTGFRSLGIASFGPIDLDRASGSYGCMMKTPKTQWNGVDVLGPLREAAGVPTMLDTDVNGAALAEMRWGEGRGVQDFAYVTVGTGIGVGLIANGLPMRGFAHCELGHIRVPRLVGDDWRGSCPFHGDCVEGLASGSSLAARFGTKGAQLLSRSDPVWETVSWALAQLCHVIVCASAPRTIAIGGGVIENHPALLGTIEAKLLESLNGYLRVPSPGSYVRAPALGPEAGPLGAISLAIAALD